MVVENWHSKEKIHLDLSKDSSIAKAVENLSDKEFEEYLFQNVLQGKIGIGGYLEERNFYRRSEVFRKGYEFRSIHLGIDIWTNANCEIYAPVDCELHSYKNNNNLNDYGATIVLKGVVDDQPIHLLFGHLSQSSLHHIAQKRFYKKGEVIGWLGDQKENGGWPPHLHLQAIKNMQGMQGDYIGVCAKEEKEIYRINCPNPFHILKLNQA